MYRSGDLVWYRQGIVYARAPYVRRHTREWPAVVERACPDVRKNKRKGRGPCPGFVIRIVHKDASNVRRWVSDESLRPRFG